MEENVALDSSKQKQFVKSIKGIKKLIKKNDATVASADNNDTLKAKDGKSRKRKRKDRGLVYLSHIPHGFYEHEMTQYFKQFGMVTNARVIRSKRTGNSKGFAFVEFREPAVAEIVADTMNNYLMGKRLIKAVYIPPEKQKRKAMRKHWSATNNPGNDRRIKMKKAYNENKDEKGELKRARKLLSNLTRTKKKLSEIGIKYDFFSPVDVPEVLADNVKEQGENKVEDSSKKEIVSKSKKNKQVPAVSEDKPVAPKDKKGGKVKNIENVIEVKQKKSVEKVIKGKVDKTKKVEKQPEVEAPKNQNKKKNRKMKEAGVQPLEEFIKLQEDSDSEGSAFEFDSDEYEKMMEQESDVSSGDDDDGDDGSESDDEDEEIDDESEEEAPPKKNKNKQLPQVLQPVPAQKNAGKRGIMQNIQQQTKRKAPQKTVAVASPKKPKFEKQNNPKARNKQFKKKK